MLAFRSLWRAFCWNVLAGRRISTIRAPGSAHHERH